MSLFVYITESCRNDARTHGLTPELESLKGQIEGKQNASQFDRFPRPYLVKKKLGGRQGRLIAQERESGEHVVIVFLAVMIRGNRDYEAGFAKDPLGYGEQHFSVLIDDLALARYLEERTRQDPVTPKPAPSEEEYQLLYSAFEDPGPVGTGDMVFETREWIEAVFQDRIQKQLALFAKPVTAALSGPEGVFLQPVEGKSGWGVWVYRRGNKLVLLTPATDESGNAAKDIAERFAEVLDGGGMDAMLKASRRAYPQIVLADDELWLDLEREREANLALSPEESQVLESTRESQHPFPLFINGRAGSGKSTILQYLFANFLHNYRRSAANGRVAPPIYLTANSELLRVARRVVKRLLRKELTIAGIDASPSETELDELLAPAFQEFYAFVGSIVPGDVRKSRFLRGKRLDYTGFRARWMERFGKDRTALREFGPDVSWHVIRTYIKGRSSETLLEPGDYAQLAESERSVTSDVYARVFERVWQGWYEDLCAAEGFWDDQDLVRYVLENDLIRPKFPAVFCDEAQDFTRLELELLLRINAFSDRSLPTNDVSRVCFVFAGDQFQTLNPTGFRWDAIKATFVEKFILELDPGRRSGRMELNYRELEFNYRSARRIVRFSNHVQALRAALFGIPDLRPQTPWLEEPREFPVVAFRNNDGVFWKKFHENAGWIVIVPCADGEETDYVRSDPVLQERIRIEDDVPQNVLSASRAKGCEYADVVVYGFGNELEAPINKVLKGDAQRVGEEKDLALEYFINRLYVAVSRAKRRLVIVDSEEGFKKLWGPALEVSAEADLLARIKNGEAVWGSAVEGMSWGVAEDLTRDVASDPRENAAAFERDGLVRRDAFLMRQAGQAYRAADDFVKARECRAKAFEFELQFVEAGAAFDDAGDALSAMRCYWTAGRDGWAALVRLKGRFPDVERELEYRFARALTGESNPSEAVNLVDQFLNRCADPEFAEKHTGSASWQQALEAIVRGSFGLDDSAGGGRTGPSITEATRMAGLLARARELGVIVSRLDEAAVNYHAERFSEAVRFWDAAGSTTSGWYFRARAYSDPYPQRVVALAKRKEWQEIVDAFRRDSDAALTVEQATAVVEALTQRGQFSDALQLGWRTRTVGGLAALGEKAVEAKELEIAERALHAWVAAAVLQSDWDVIERLIDSDGGAKLSGPGGMALRAAIAEQRPALRLTFVRAFARSGSLLTASESATRRVTEFLRDRLRVKDADWRAWVSIEEAGAAIERAGRFTDALAFYDALRKQAGAETEQHFAKRRGLVAKSRQLAYEKSKRESGQTRQLERDLKQAMASIGVASIEELGEFPALPPIDLSTLGKALSPPRESVEPEAGVSPAGAAGAAPDRPDRVVCQIGDFTLELSRAAKRLNITKTQSMEQAFVKVLERQCGGEGGMQRVTDHEFSADAWGLKIRIDVEGGADCIEIALKELGARVRLIA